jgi:acyl-CoA thioester hydrolase
MGIVHHASYIVYFEEGRTNYTRERGADYVSFERTGHYLAVAEIHARYHQTARFDQQLVVRCWLSEVRSRGVTFSYEIVDAESRKLIVTGSSKHICITTDGQPAHLPEPWRSWADV